MILVVGPLPNPINGCSLANQVLVKRLKELQCDVRVINMAAPIQSSDLIGKFSVKKLLSQGRVYAKLPLIKRASVVYTTPGQTFLGILKYAPFFLLCRLLNIPYVVHIHGNHLGNEYRTSGSLKKWIIRLCLAPAANGIVLSESLRPNFAGLLPPDKISVVENFVPEDLIPKSLAEKNRGQLRLLFLSNLMKEKGFGDFINSLKILESRKIDFSASIAGKFENESEPNSHNHLWNGNGAVQYHGVVAGEEKKKLLNHANVFVLPTYYRMEGQPISLIEAMATGNIVVTTRHSGIPDIVSESNGFFVSQEDPTDLANVLEEIHRHLPEYIDRISTFNYDYATTRFKEESFSSKILLILENVSKPKRI